MCVSIYLERERERERTLANERASVRVSVRACERTCEPRGKSFIGRLRGHKAAKCLQGASACVCA